jgi:hypothetical protein
MPMFLGLDGKRRAVEACAGYDLTSPTLWFGLLEQFPEGADTLDLATLVGPTAGDEFTPSSSFYGVGRQEITFAHYGVPKPLICTSNNGLVQWQNTSVSTTYTVRGLFIASVGPFDDDDATGEVLWVGYPDIGDIPVAPTRGIEFDNGIIDLAVNYTDLLL